MSRERSIRLGKIKAQFTRLPLPDKFSRIVSVILTHVDRDRYLCWPSKARIAKQVGCSEKCVARNLKAVKQLGLFTISTLGASEMRRVLGDRFKASKSGQRLYNLYRLNPDHPIWKGEGVEEATQVIRETSYAGVAERSSKAGSGSTMIESPSVDKTPPPCPAAVVEEARIGTGPSPQTRTGPTGLNRDGPVPGISSLLGHGVVQPMKNALSPRPPAPSQR